MMHTPGAGAAQPTDGSSIQWGTVGWVNDGGTVVELGDSTNDGTHLVRVTLFRGRAPHQPLDQTQAQGVEVLCQLADGIAVPARGAKVLVAIPVGCQTLPGGPVIINLVSNNVPAQANMAAGEIVLQVPGSPAQIIIRKNGAIILKTQDTQGNTSFLKLDPVDGLQYVHPAVTLRGDGNGWRMRHVGGASLVLTAIGLPSPLGALSSYAKLSAALTKVDGSKVFLGPDSPTTVWMSIVWGPDPSPGPVLLTGVKSSCVVVATP